MLHPDSNRSCELPVTHHCVVKISSRWPHIAVEILPRACLKIHSRHLHAPLCGIFGPNSLNVAHYAAFIWAKSPTKWNAQLPESNFQTRSSGKQFSNTLWCSVRPVIRLPVPIILTVCKAEEGGDAVASLTDDNAADGNSGKPFGEM